MNLSIPCGNAVCRTPLPAGMTADQASVLAVAVVNAVAAALAKGRRVGDWAAYGLAVARAGTAAFEGGEWDGWAAGEAELCHRLAGMTGRPHEPSLDGALSALLLPGDHAHALVRSWAWTILGHRLGDTSHPAACQPCFLFAYRRWGRLLAECERNERTLLNLAAACVASGHMDPLPGRAITEAAERAAAASHARELAAARGEDF